jgi:pyruvate/2-oxoglutarate dehydrogenase complex dihydrolipoamide acyltransferase (E2) component
MTISLNTPAIKGQMPATVCGVFVNAGEVAPAGSVILAIKTDKEIFELKALSEKKVSWVPPFGMKVGFDDIVCQLDEEGLARRNYAWSTKDVDFPLQVLNSVPVNTVLEKEEMMLYVRDAQGRSFPVVPARAVRVLSVASPGEMLKPDVPFAQTQDLGEESRLGLPRALTYPVRVTAVGGEKGARVLKGDMLCDLKDSAGKRVRLSAKQDAWVTYAGLELDEMVSAPLEAFRLRAEPSKIEGICWENKPVVAPKPQAAPKPQPTPKPSPSTGHSSQATSRSGASRPGSGTGGARPQEAAHVQGGVFMTLWGWTWKLVVFFLACAAVTYVLNEDFPDVGDLIADVKTEIFGTERDVEDAPHTSSTAARNAGGNLNLVDLESLSNGNTPTPTSNQQRAFEEALR